MEREMDYLKVVLLGQLTIEAIENLEGTVKYKRNVKNQGNKFVKMLEDYVKEDYNSVYLNNEEMTTNVLRKIDDLVNKIKEADVDELVMLDDIIDRYKNNKKWFADNVPINFLKIDK